MADVLIEGIRLPNYGEVMVELQAGGNVRYVDAYGEFKYGKATTIPAHGDLIDRDELFKKCEWANVDDDTDVRAIRYDVVCNAPTVIPASREAE